MVARFEKLCPTAVPRFEQDFEACIVHSLPAGTPPGSADDKYARPVIRRRTPVIEVGTDLLWRAFRAEADVRGANLRLRQLARHSRRRVGTRTTKATTYRANDTSSRGE